MAERNKVETQTSEPANTEKQAKEKPVGFLHSIIVIVLAVLIVVVVSIGGFYYVAKNNINGFAETLKPHIQKFPVLGYFMPDELPGYDPDDPIYLTNKQILEKYNEYRENVKRLNASLDEANAKIEDMKSSDEALLEQEALVEENRKLLESIEAQKASLEEVRVILEQLITQGDKDGFAEYFESVDKETAQAIYEEVARDRVISDEKKRLAEPFAKMDPQGAARMITELYLQDKDVALNILEGMEAKTLAPILERIEAKTAAALYSLLSERKLNK